MNSDAVDNADNADNADNSKNYVKNRYYVQKTVDNTYTILDNLPETIDENTVLVVNDGNGWHVEEIKKDNSGGRARRIRKTKKSRGGKARRFKSRRH